MGSPASKAACADQIARLQSNIAASQVHLAQARNITDKELRTSRVNYIKGEIARQKAEVAALRAKMKTLK